MAEQSTPFPKSWGLWFLTLIALWVLGPAMAYFGYYGVQTSETIVVIIAACCLFAGPVAVIAAPFLPRPQSGPCPLCGAKMYRFGQTEDTVLVCRNCAACSTTANAKLTLVPLGNVADKPVYPAALPWDDIVDRTQKTIALSAQDIVADKINDLITKNLGLRVLDKWPPGCCVCGAPASRNEDTALEVMIKGHARETKATVVARGVPYCGKHKDGVAFARFDFAALPFQDPGFGILFKSHATREAFRKLNPHRFDYQEQGAPRIRTS